MIGQRIDDGLASKVSERSWISGLVVFVELIVSSRLFQVKMKTGRNQVRPDPSVLSAVIAHSQIVAMLPAVTAQHLPAGFDDVDIAILELIAAEGRRIRPNFLPI